MTVLNGQDRARLIGAPKGVADAVSVELDPAEAWRAACARVFSGSRARGEGAERPGERTPWMEGGDGDVPKDECGADEEKYAEPEVDAMRARKMEELESFKKQQQMLVRQGATVARWECQRTTM